jgi:polysaccharide deacetylase family protein (PEP-CTERM system associated)
VNPAQCVFSVDVEDWFHILDLPSTPSMSQWASLPSRVEADFRTLLDLFAAADVSVTCFFLGWIAERYPHLVKEAADAGHEVAAHGYAHRLVYRMSQAEFYEDARRAKQVLEDILGREVVGYRATGFSVTSATDWFFEVLLKAGYRYDSSVFPAARGHGGLKGGCLTPHVVRVGSDRLIEFPATVSRLAGRPMCFFGGGYLRLYPYPLIAAMTRRVLREGRPVIFYVHPREIDPEQPRLPMSVKRRFQSYVNLRSTAVKITRLLNTFSFTTFEKYIVDRSWETDAGCAE